MGCASVETHLDEYFCPNIAQAESWAKKVPFCLLEDLFGFSGANRQEKK